MYINDAKIHLYQDIIAYI